MKKYLTFIAFTFLILITNVYASNTVKYSNDEGYWIEIDKSKDSIYVVDDNERKPMYTINNFKLPNVVDGAEPDPFRLYTSENDPAYLERNKWWSQITVCVSGHADNVLTFIMEAIPTLLGETPPDTGSEFAHAYTEIMKEEIEKFQGYGDEKIDWKDYWFADGDAVKCVELYPEDVSKENIVYNCSLYDNFVTQVRQILSEYDKNNISSKVNTINKYNKILVSLKESCKSVLKNQNYKNSCTLRCLGIEDDLEQWGGVVSKKIDYQICGFSERLILYIANIIRWIKYIIPVAVIVLGILDFIKAIGTDKDDEMKKAQKRFVIRLIAAALIFILPFIIEFVLEKMGFATNGCGIIDL